MIDIATIEDAMGWHHAYFELRDKLLALPKE